MLKRILLILAILVIGVAGYYASTREQAKTLTYNCDVLGTYQLVIPWFGEPAFYQMIDGKREVQPSEITPETVRFWLSEKDRLANPAESGGGMVIDRKTLWTEVNQCLEIKPHSSD